jgi:hypothetical protein
MVKLCTLSNETSYRFSYEQCLKRMAWGHLARYDNFPVAPIRKVWKEMQFCDPLNPECNSQFFLSHLGGISFKVLQSESYLSIKFSNQNFVYVSPFAYACCMSDPPPSPFIAKRHTSEPFDMCFTPFPVCWPLKSKYRQRFTFKCVTPILANHVTATANYWKERRYSTESQSLVINRFLNKDMKTEQNKTYLLLCRKGDQPVPVWRSDDQPAYLLLLRTQM